MRLSKKLLSIVLCLIMAFGSVAVGGNGLFDAINTISLKAFADNNYYTAAFYINDSSIDNEAYCVIEVEQGAPFECPADPEREGFTFAGWVDENDNPSYYSIMPNHNLVFYACWVANEYSIKWISNNELYMETVFCFEDQIIVPSPPNWEGHGFLGWTPTVPERMPAQNLVFNAQWTSADIPHDAVNYNGHFYKAFDESMTWTEAKAYCENLGGHLVTILSKDENDFVSTLIENKAKNLYWLGAYEKNGENDWQWVTEEKWTYSNWGAGEPDNAGIESYVEMYRIPRDGNGLGEWNDMKNNGDNDFYAVSNTGFICEWDSANNQIPADATTFNGHSYKVFDEGMTWTEAKAYCESLGGHLVTITSQEEQIFVESILEKGTKNSYWVGGTGGNKIFGWITGEPFNYTNWSRLQPDNNQKSGGEDSLMMYRLNNPSSGSGLGKWNDLNNNGTCGNESFFGLSNFGFVCEWESAILKAPYWGDLNGDYKVDFNDILIYNKIRLGKTEPTQEQRCFMDVDLDGSIEKSVDLSNQDAEDVQDFSQLESVGDSIPNDMLLMNKYRLGKLSSFPADSLADYEFVPPIKTEYAVGEDFNPAGMKIIITNKENPTVRYELTKRIGVSAFDSSVKGVQFIKASLSGLEFSFSVVVGNESKEKTITGIFEKYEEWHNIDTNKKYYSPVTIDGVEYEALEDLISSASEADCYIGREIKATLYNGTIISVDLAENDTIDKTDYSYDSYDWIEDNKYTKKLSTQKAAIDFKDAMKKYLDALGKGVGNFETVDYDNIAKQLKNDSHNYYSLNGELDKSGTDAVYYALAKFITDVAENNKLYVRIDYNKTAMQNAISITNDVFNSLQSGPVYNYCKGNYKISFDVSLIGNAFSGQITVIKYKGSNSGTTYIGPITSGLETTTNLLYAYINNLGDIVKDGCKYALASIVHEYLSVLGIAQATEESIEQFFSNKAQILLENGYGDVLRAFKAINVGYRFSMGLRDEISGKDLDFALSTSAKLYYDTIKSLDFSDDAVRKHAVKVALNGIKKAQHKLEDALYNYIYDIDTGDPDNDGFFERAFNGNRISIKCPVDFDLYDKYGNLIGYVDSIGNHQDYIYYTDGVYVDVDGNAKYIYYPSDMEVNIVLKAFDDGEMNYSIENFTLSKPTGRINFYNVPLSKSDEFSQTIPANVDLKSQFDELSLNIGSKKISADDYYSVEDELGRVKIECVSSAGGVATGKGCYPIGAIVKMYAISDGDKNVFNGWYLNDKLISTDTIYQFVAKKDLKLVAKFEKNTDCVPSTPDTPDTLVNPTASSKLLVPSNAEVEYAATVTVKAKATDVPEGYYVALYDGNTFLKKGSNTEVSYTFPGEFTGTKNITAKIIDNDENVQKDGNGTDLTASFEVKAKSGFFAKLMAFFKRLFRSLPAVIVEPK